MYSIETKSPEETLGFGKKLGKLLKPGDIVALVGDLGAGKTWLSKGIAESLGVPDHEYVNSPAFDLIHEYPGRCPMYHIDFYRMDGLSDDDIPWLDEYFHGDGVTIVEWADKFVDQLADSFLRIDMSQTDTKNARKLTVSANGGDYARIIDGLKAS